MELQYSSPYVTPAPGYGPPAYTIGGQAPQPGDTADVCHMWKLFLAAALAGGAGIRAVAPLFLLSAFHLMYPEEYPLSDSAQWLGHHGVCIALGILLVIEVLADQVPAVDHALHAILTPAHPITGALAAVAPNYCGGVAAQVPMAFIGASTALSVHASKALLRHASTSVSCGVLNPIVSVIESVLSVLLLMLCFALPVASVVVAVLFIAGACCGAKKLISLGRGEMREEDDADMSEDEERNESRALREENRRLREQLTNQQALTGLVTGHGPAAELEAPAE